MANSVPSMPDYQPRCEWINAPDDYIGRTWNTVYPPVIKLANGDMIVDECHPAWFTGQTKPIQIKVLKAGDHPNIKALPANAPRKVKSIYRAEVQLRMVRETQSSRMLQDAYDAWADYHKPE